jgi:2-C-methyl-D-erythritol 2,4-cyclodiphosphate synthase
MRIGIGYDVHRLVQGRPLVLGGVSIPFDKGLMGHSDADVLVHAACDALLGAAGLGDLGEHFPDSDEAFRGIYSIELLKRCRRLVQEKGYGIVNLDGVIMAQAPKLNPFRREMEKTMAAALDMPTDRINVKATTTEGLGFVGRQEGIAAQCVVLIDVR